MVFYEGQRVKTRPGTTAMFTGSEYVVRKCPTMSSRLYECALVKPAGELATPQYAFTLNMVFSFRVDELMPVHAGFKAWAQTKGK